MIRAFLTLVALGFLFVPDPATVQFELKSRKIKITKQTADVFPELELQAQEALAGALKEPKYKSKDPQKFLTTFGESVEVLFAVDEKRAGKGYTSLYADVTGLGDLTKGKRVSGKPVVRGSYYRDTTFAPFEVQIPIEDGAEAFPVQARFAARFDQPGAPAPSSSSLYLTSLCAMEGKVEFGETKQTMVIFDANCNGVFGEKASATAFGASSKSDRIWVGKGAGKLDQAYMEALPIGKYYAFEDKYYELDFSDGDSVSITETEVPLGKIQVSQPGFIFELADGNEVLCVSGGKEQVINMPVGDYKVVAPSFRQKYKGAIWELEGKLGSCKAKFDVAEGGTTEVAVGPPLKVVIDAKVKSQYGATYVTMDFKLEGANGEEYQFLKKDGRKVALPEISIRNSRGREVKKGRFEYG